MSLLTVMANINHINVINIPLTADKMAAICRNMNTGILKFRALRKRELPGLSHKHLTSVPALPHDETCAASNELKNVSKYIFLIFCKRI